MFVHCRRVRRIMAVGLALAAALAGAATASSKQPRRVAAKLGEYSIKLNRSSDSSGRITFSIRNGGAAVHEFIVLKTRLAAERLPRKGDKVDEHAAGRLVDEAEGIKPGTTAKLSVTLKPGTYVLLCNLAGHYLGGMRASFRVR